MSQIEKLSDTTVATRIVTLLLANFGDVEAGSVVLFGPPPTPFWPKRIVLRIDTRRTADDSKEIAAVTIIVHGVSSASGRRSASVSRRYDYVAASPPPWLALIVAPFLPGPTTAKESTA